VYYTVFKFRSVKNTVIIPASTSTDFINNCGGNLSARLVVLQAYSDIIELVHLQKSNDLAFLMHSSTISRYQNNSWDISASSLLGEDINAIET
jgi:hypothetical protein